ncbi:RAN GTPase-activating protein 2 [Phytophthora boehmeriae]|uniref:RAN GTPase-activating protein 2 n=1 Tax=Phytophthora boehmeriae TaxID=109152 RepID=A0A8T1WL43_9STRA|nr:RAN GTPase-activating protein 2 [Phytophthora boehmeriae]
MAAQIDLNNAARSLTEDAPMSKLEAARQAAAQQQKKRIDAAVARVTSIKKQGSSKRKSLEAKADEQRHKKSKTLVDVAQDPLDKKNSIARRLVDRFSSLPEPEQEEQVAATRSVATEQFVARSTTISTSENTLSETTETVSVTKEVKIEEKHEESAVVSQDEEVPEEEAVEKSDDWEGPTTNFHVKQLGLNDKVDIYAPVEQQQEEIRRIRERSMYLPEPKSIATLETASDSENDSDFAPNDAESDDSEGSDAESLPDVDADETRALAEEKEEFERSLVEKAAVTRRTWAKRLFVFTPLAILAFIVLVFAILFAIDWSQETFQFCAVDVENAEGSEDLLSCSSFVETQSQIKNSLRETAEKVQETVQSYFE